MEIAKTNINPNLIAESAGYDDHGNDRHGHMHVSQMGSFIRNGLMGRNMVRGFYCAAPTVYADGKYYCTDPSSEVMEVLCISQSDIDMVIGKGK